MFVVVVPPFPSFNPPSLSPIALSTGTTIKPRPRPPPPPRSLSHIPPLTPPTGLSPLLLPLRTLLVSGLLLREEQHVVLHGPDHEGGDGEEDEEDDDDDGDGDVFLDHFFLFCPR